MWRSESHQRIKMGGGHAYITKKASLLNALSIKTPHQVTRVGGSSVGLAKNEGHSGQLGQTHHLRRGR